MPFFVIPGVIWLAGPKLIVAAAALVAVGAAAGAAVATATNSEK